MKAFIAFICTLFFPLAVCYAASASDLPETLYLQGPNSWNNEKTTGYEFTKNGSVYTYECKADYPNSKWKINNGTWDYEIAAHSEHKTFEANTPTICKFKGNDFEFSLQKGDVIVFTHRSDYDEGANKYYTIEVKRGEGTGTGTGDGDGDNNNDKLNATKDPYGFYLHSQTSTSNGGWPDFYPDFSNDNGVYTYTYKVTLNKDNQFGFKSNSHGWLGAPANNNTFGDDGKTLSAFDGTNFKFTGTNGSEVTITYKATYTSNTPYDIVISVKKPDGTGTGDGDSDGDDNNDQGQTVSDPYNYIYWGQTKGNGDWHQENPTVTEKDSKLYYTFSFKMNNGNQFGFKIYGTDGTWLSCNSDNESDYKIGDDGKSYSSFGRNHNFEFSGTSGKILTITFEAPRSNGIATNIKMAVTDAPYVDPNNVKPSGSLPILYITTDAAIIDKDLKDKEYRKGTYWLDPNGDTSIEQVGSAEEPLSLEIKARGNYTRTGFSKKPYKLKLGTKEELMGLSKSKHFALLAHADDDKGYLKNFVGFYLGNEIFQSENAPKGIFTPKEKPVEVVINGNYRGLYFLTESIRVEKTRINIEELGDTISDPALISGGYVVELDNYPDDNQIVLNEGGNAQNLLRITPDTPELYSPLQRKFVKDQFQKMDDLIYSKSDDLWKYMDLDMAARYYVVMEIIGHWEAYHGSTYLYRNRGEGQHWFFSPLWDCGNAFGTETNKYFTNASANRFGNTWIGKMRENSTFLDKVKSTYRWFKGNKMGELENAITAYVKKIEAAAKQDHLRWEDAELPKQYNDPTNNNYPTNPTAVIDNSNVVSIGESVKKYLRDRCNWLNGEWGEASSSATEPTWNNYEAAPLPEYAKEGYEVPESTKYTVYLKYKDSSSARIWIWDSNEQHPSEIGNDYANRPSMTKATDKDGETYYYFSFSSDTLVPTGVKFTTDKGDSGDLTYTNNKLYIYDGSNWTETLDWNPGNIEEPDLDPTPGLVKHNLDTDNVTLYLINEANWNVTTDAPVKVYVDGDGTSWSGHKMDYDENLEYGDFKGLYKYVVPTNDVNRVVIFNHNGSDQYPANGDPMLPINGKSHIFNNKTHKWEEVKPYVEPTLPKYSGKLALLSINDVASMADLEAKNTTTATLLFDPLEDSDALAISTAQAIEIEGRGSDTWNNWNKKPYKIKATNKLQFFNSAAESKHWLLLPWCADTELAFLRNVAGNEIARMLDFPWTPQEEPVELMLNGEYQGIYFIVESIRPSVNRVNIMDIGDTKKTAMPNEWHNWIVELDQTKAFDAENPNAFTFTHKYGNNQEMNVNFFSDAINMKSGKDLKGGKFQGTHPEAGISYEEVYKANYQADMKKLADAINSMSKNERSVEWMGVINPEDAAKFYLLNELMDDPRAFQTGCYLYLGHQDADANDTDDTHWHFGPVWDFSTAFSSQGAKDGLLHEADGANVPLMEGMWSNLWFKYHVLLKYFDLTEEGKYDPSLAPRRVAASGISSSSQLATVQNKLEAVATKLDGALAYDAQQWKNDEKYNGVTSTTASDQVTQVMDYLTGNKNYLDTVFTHELMTGINNPQAAGNSTAPVEYFDLQGRRISNPQPGSICIRRQGAVVTKIVK